MLEVKNVGKIFFDDEKFEVIKDVSMRAEDGEFVCVIGPTGCGKTILLYLIAGFLNPTAGEILIDGRPAGKPNINRAMVFQNYVLFPWMTVFGNVYFGLENFDIDKNKKISLVMESLKLVGLEDFKDWNIHKLSGGMQQRVAIARALVVNPRILLMDEPFAALDAQHRRHMRDQLIEIWKATKKTIIFVTHGVSEAVYLADKIYLLSARPAVVKEVINIDLPKPIDRGNRRFIEICNRIESHLKDEFKTLDFEKTTEKFYRELMENNL